MIKYLLLLNIIFVLMSCDDKPDIDDSMLDGSIIMDSSLLNPANYLLSEKYKLPSQEQKNTPVIITVHGYSASTYEWDEFKAYLSDTKFPGTISILNSQVLLGGHGRSYEDFRTSSWQDWQRAITKEFEALAKLGYTNISLAGSSTGCPLILDLFAKGYFKNKLSPNEVFLIDPIIIPSSKILSLINVLGPMIGYIDTEEDGEKAKHWYRFRPYESLQELNEVINNVRHQLEDGIKLSSGTRMKVYKAKQDDAADPVSAVLIYKGVSNSNGSKIDIEMIDSDIHVFTTLGVEENVSSKDLENQRKAFADIIERCLNSNK